MHEWIRAARLSAEMTQTELAEAMGVTKGNVSAWENARHEASHEQLLRIAQITKTETQLEGIDKPLATPSVRWPFVMIDLNKMSKLSADEAAKLEGVILLGAAQLGLDVKK